MFRPEEIDLYTDHYFLNSRLACAKAGNHLRVVYQVFQRSHALLCGVRYVLELLRHLPPEVQVHGLEDGSRIAPMESVLHISGPITELLEHETVYLGLLSRMTRVATNVHSAVEAAKGKPLLFFAARFDVPEVQEYDGYAAKVGGAAGASTEAEARAFAAPALGTMPHALIAKPPWPWPRPFPGNQSGRWWISRTTRPAPPSRYFALSGSAALSSPVCAWTAPKT
jgi:nicotinate phosphoribosyltransferase